MQISTALSYISQSPEIVELREKRERRFKRLFKRLLFYFLRIFFSLFFSRHEISFMNILPGRILQRALMLTIKTFRITAAVPLVRILGGKSWIAASLRIKQGFWEV